jgi:hypothetical protein
MKIDIDNDDLINWDDLSTYMLLRTQGQKIMNENSKLKLYDGDTTRLKNTIATIHKEMIVKVQYLQDNKRYMSCCREGTICYWNESFRLQRSFKNAG